MQRKQQRALDDLLFLFACVSLIAATILLVKETTSIYLLATLITSFVDGSGLEDQFGSSLQNFQLAHKVIQSEGYAYSVLIWAAIFAVKFCYLCFFRLLIDRLKGMVTYWRITMGITALSAGFNICALFIACPYFGQRSCELSLPFPLSPSLHQEECYISS